MGIEDIARPEVRDLKAYVAAEQIAGMIRLNANESPESPWADLDSSPLNRYPLVRPVTLRDRLADLYGVAAERILVTRGSTEAIDTLVRTFCRAYTDNAVVTPPTFDMYKVYADLQAIELRRAPLDRERDFAFSADGVLAAANSASKLIFVCSPNNPTGTVVAPDDVRRVAAARRDQSVVVVDEAYVEFSSAGSMLSLIDEFDNVVILRTTSKAFALAGARCGALVGRSEAITLLSRVLTPYSFSTPVTERVLAAMTDAGFEKAQALVQRLVSERKRLAEALARLDVIQKVWPSEANFLFVRFANVDAARAALKAHRILIREFASLPDFAGCARITVGTAAENDSLLQVLQGLET